MIFNLVSGSTEFATVKVTCPVGATVTITDGTRTYTKTSTSTTVSFTLPVAGTWTVTVTKNGVTETKTINVTTKGETYEEPITLVKYIFKEGEGAKVPLSAYAAYDDVYGYYGRCNIRNSDIYISFDEYCQGSCKDAGFYFTNAIDLTGYSKLVIELKNQNAFFFINKRESDGWHTTNIKYFQAYAQRRVETVDISSLTGDTVLEFETAELLSWTNVYNIYLEVANE